MSAPPDSKYLGYVAKVAALADLDGDEWEIDDIPKASLELAAVCNPRAVLAIVEEIGRLREALALIAAGNISPAMSFAQRVLDGEQPREALTAEIAARRARAS